MSDINFPDAPTENEIAVLNGISWIWDGASWSKLFKGWEFSHLNDDLYYNNGNIGIGTDESPHKLTVLGDLGVGDNLYGDPSVLDGIIFSSTSTSGYQNTIKHIVM